MVSVSHKNANILLIWSHVKKILLGCSDKKNFSCVGLLCLNFLFRESDRNPLLTEPCEPKTGISNWSKLCDFKRTCSKNYAKKYKNLEKMG